MKKTKDTALVEGYQPDELEVRPRSESNEYYIRLSQRVKLVKYVSILVLIVFILGMLSIFRSDITIENCRYLLRFFTSTSSVYSGSYDAIYYDTEGVLDVEMFNSDLVTLRSDGIEMYNLTGSNTASYDISYTTPKVVTGGKYMLVYDLGGNGISLYNNFSQMYSENLDYPVSIGAVSSEGMFAVASKSADYKSVIYLYDHNFKLISKIYRDEYLMDMKINSDASSIGLLSLSAVDGVYKSKLVLGKPYSENTIEVELPDGEIAVKCGFHSGGNLSVLSDKALRIYNSSGKMVYEYVLGSFVPDSCLILDDYTIISYEKNIVGSESEVMAFSKSGKLAYQTTIDEKIKSIDGFYDSAYLLLDNSVVKISLSKGERLDATIDEGASKIFACDSDNLVVNFPNQAITYKSAELFYDDSYTKGKTEETK